jgi:hypothetical protein
MPVSSVSLSALVQIIKTALPPGYLLGDGPREQGGVWEGGRLLPARLVVLIYEEVVTRGFGV